MPLPGATSRFESRTIPAPSLFSASPDNGRRAAAECGKPYPHLVGCAPSIAKLRETLRRVAPRASNVLILGESGTGKEVLARTIHAESTRAAGPFVAVNCGALPETLAEAELFGYERGAFTGAVQTRPGPFEQAHTGTLFLDEVTECAPTMQVKLLRALQEREIQRLGGTRRIPVDVRIIAASNRDLGEAVRAGTLRTDLYYRLRVVELSLPPLRERKEDIALLSEHFLRKYSAMNGASLRAVSPAALWAMEEYDWPGNVRELENAVERATVLAGDEDGDELLPGHLPPEIISAQGMVAPDLAPGSPFDLEAALQQIRNRYISAALRLTNGNKTEAARLLGISRRGLYNLLNNSDFCSATL